MKRILSLLLLLALLAGCGSSPAPTAQTGEGDLRVLCTTYPVYLFTTAVTQGVEGVEVSLLVNVQTSCLHDYTLTVNDMKAIERADVILLNGAGLEDFMADALSHATATVIDCSEGIALLKKRGGDRHFHDDEDDPHIWMDPRNAAAMIGNAAAGLSSLLPGAGEKLEANRQAALTALKGLLPLAETSSVGPATGWTALESLPLITFHDGFQYFADCYGLDLLKAIEEEEGATASAAEIQEMVGLVKEKSIPAIFTERNGSAATAQAIAAETGCAVRELDMIMSGTGEGLQPYLDAMESNLTTILEGLG